MTKNKLAFFTMLAAALLSLPVAQAQSWSTVGSTCQPGSDSIGLFAYSNGTYEFAPGETGKIATRCQVNNPLDTGVPAWKSLTAGFRDPDGRGGDYEVQVSLERVAKSTGLHGIIVTLDSNSYTNTGATSKTVTFSHAFDFTNFSYYVLLNVSRTDSSAAPGVWFASLR